MSEERQDEAQPSLRAAALRERAELADDDETREALLATASEVESLSLNGAAAPREGV